MHTPARTLCAFLCAAAAWAQAPAEPRRPPQPSIRTTGEATVTAKPDRAIIAVGVVTQAQNAQAAGAQNATKLDAVLRQLKSVAGAGAEIGTQSYSLEPNYRYPKPGGQPELTGYTARNVLQVTTPDLASVGKIIDTATQAGANNIERLEFTLKDDQAARTQALREAAGKARASADAIAAALGVKVTGVLFAEESGSVGPPPRPVYAMARMAAEAQAPPTPVTPGTLEVRGAVTLTVGISQ